MWSAIHGSGSLQGRHLGLLLSVGAGLLDPFFLPSSFVAQPSLAVCFAIQAAPNETSTSTLIPIPAKSFLHRRRERLSDEPRER